MRGPFAAIALAALGLCAAPAEAQTETAAATAAGGARLAWLVVADDEVGGPETGALEAEAAVELSRGLLGAGWDVRRVAWDGNAAALPDIRAPRGARVVVVAPDQTPFLPVASALLARGASEALVIGAACAPAPEGGAAMLAPRTAEDGTCPEVDLAARIGAALAAARGEGWDAAAPLRLSGPFGPLRPAPARPASAPVVIGGGGVVLGGALAPAAPAASTTSGASVGGGVTIGGAAPASASGSAPPSDVASGVVASAATVPSPAAGGGVALGRARPVAFATGGGTSSLSIGAVAQPAALLAARAPDPGLPRPSIIVGRLPSQDGADPVEEGGSLAGAGVDVDGYEARERLRRSDPEEFARLVGSGAFDPLPEALPAALQTALQRMGCYRMAIDGDWGNGSRGAVDRYYAQRGDPAPTREAQVALFRDVILREDVTCPAPVAAAAPRRATPAATTTRRAAPARSQTRRAAPARAAPARTAPAPAQPSGRINPTFSGAFR